MDRQFYELRERLLQAGVAPRHVRRYLNELTDHLADLTAEEERAGRSRADAESAALLRLGGVDDLSKAMIEQRQFRSWSVRAPWAAFGFAPLLLLAVAYCIALFILWSGWNFFLPGAETPFGARVDGIAILYFQLGKSIFFGAPIFIGWAVAFIAARQRLKPTWPAISLLLIALAGGSAQVHTLRNTEVAVAGHVSLGFTFAPSVQGSPFGLFHALVILSFTALPYLIWRLRKTPSLSA